MLTSLGMFTSGIAFWMRGFADGTAVLAFCVVHRGAEDRDLEYLACLM